MLFKKKFFVYFYLFAIFHWNIIALHNFVSLLVFAVALLLTFLRWQVRVETVFFCSLIQYLLVPIILGTAHNSNKQNRPSLCSHRELVF